MRLARTASRFVLIAQLCKIHVAPRCLIFDQMAHIKIKTARLCLLWHAVSCLEVKLRMKSMRLPLFLLSALLTACGGSSSGGSSSSAASASQQEGQFVDSPITGLGYRPGNEIDVRLTGPRGEFQFTSGQSIAFSLGGIQLGSAPGQPFITPTTLANGNESIRTNLARFFQTLDNDGNPDNGIILAPRVRDRAQALSLSLAAFSVDPADFAASEAAQFAISANGDNRVLIDALEALKHLTASERDIADGQFDYDGGVDSDNDGINDAVDACPQTPVDATVDADGCAPGEALQDDDGDSIANGEDNCPAISNSDQADFDADGRGDACDNDVDGDGLVDSKDPNPTSTDSDNDGVPDGQDNCPAISNSDKADLDGDAIGDACDDDRDGDGTPNDMDAFADDPNEDSDTDGDGIGDNADAFPGDPNESQDTDSDGTGDSSDNCPQTPNQDQKDTDNDGNGDVCDSDLDGDGADNESDNCPLVSNKQSDDLDGDSVGDACDSDIDGDGIENGADADNDNDGVNDNDLLGGDEDFCHGTPLNTPTDEVHTQDATNKGCTDNQLAQGDYCADGGIKVAGGNFAVDPLVSESGHNIAFQLMEPDTIDCATLHLAAHPLILHGHGFGGSRTTERDRFADYLSKGYAVISIDQRGFGDSAGTIRTMDPEFEGKDLVQILDWAEENLPYLAWKNDATEKFISRPAPADKPAHSVANGDNLVVGAIGSSYGGGYQLLILAVDEKNRLDALVPDITWHDLRYSLNPGDTIKTGWDLALVAGGESGSYGPGLENGDSPNDRGLDPYIKETLTRGASTNEFPREALKWFNYHSLGFWCANQGLPTMPYQVTHWGENDSNTMLSDGGVVPSPGDKPRTLPAVDVLLTQGFRDTLFNFNDAWWNYQCLSALGGDVRLYTHQSGHILAVAAPDDAQPTHSGAPAPVIPAFQDAGGPQSCGATNLTAAGNTTDSLVLKWFDAKLRQFTGVDLGSENICISLADEDSVSIPADMLIAPDANAQAATQIKFSSSPVPNGELAVALAANGPTVVELGSVADVNGAILAGIPQLDVTVATAAGANELASDCSPPDVPTLRTGCDSIVFVGIGQQKADSGFWDLVDDQIYPLRGLGKHSVNLNGIAERIEQGDKLALLVYGFHPQFPASYSRDVSIEAVELNGSIGLPLYAADEDGNADLAKSAASALTNTCGSPETAPIGVTSEGGEALLQDFTRTDFEQLDFDSDGCAAQYKALVPVDVVRKQDSEREVRNETTTIFNLDVPRWVTYVICHPSPDQCSALRPLVEVGNFDLDEDNELRINAPMSADIGSDVPPNTSSINSVQWKPNADVAAVGVKFSITEGNPQTAMTVLFDAGAAIGDILVNNNSETVSVQAGDLIKAKLWHTTVNTEGNTTLDYRVGGLYTVDISLIRNGSTEFFARHNCSNISLSDFDPRKAGTAACDGSSAGAGWLLNFVQDWRVTEVAFDDVFNFANPDDPVFSILDDVELVIAQ